MNKLYPWLPIEKTEESEDSSEEIDHTYYFLVTCKTVNPTVNYKEIEDVVCINKYSRRFLEETNAEFIVYDGAEVEIVLNDVILSFDKFQAIHKVYMSAEHCIYGCDDEDITTFKSYDRRNWIPYHVVDQEIRGALEYTDRENLASRHVVVNNEFITAWDSSYISNQDYVNCVYFKIPTHLNKDQSLFLYTPHQIYNLYINFIMSKEDIKEFIYI